MNDPIEKTMVDAFLYICIKITAFFGLSCVFLLLSIFIIMIHANAQFFLHQKCKKNLTFIHLLLYCL